MPKTPEELIEINERRVRAKEKEAERKEKSRLYNLEMRAIDTANRKEEARQKGLEYAKQYRFKKKQDETPQLQKKYTPTHSLNEYP